MVRILCLVVLGMSAFAPAMLSADEKLHPELQAALNDGSVQERVETLRAVAEAGESAVPHLITLLDDSQARIRLAAAIELLKTENRTGKEKALKELQKLLRDSDEAVRKETALELAEVGEKAAPLVNRVSVEIHRGGLGVEGVAVLKAVGNEHSIELLSQALSHRDTEVKRAALRALGEVGAAARIEIEAVLRLFRDRSVPSVEIIEALSRIGGGRALNAVINALRSHDAEVRASAARHLPAFGDEAVRALPALVRLSDDSDAEVRKAARRAYRELSGVEVPEPEPEK